MENIKRLPDAESDVMQALWNIKTPALRLDIEKELKNFHPMEKTTLLTLLSRLNEKGFIEVKKEGRNSFYSPLISSHDYIGSQSKRFFDKFCKGSMKTFASALCDSGITKEDLEELRDLLNKEEL